MEQPDFEPTIPDFEDTHPQRDFENPEEFYPGTREEYMEELEKHRHSVQTLLEQSQDQMRGQEERAMKLKLWKIESLDLLQKEERLQKGKIIFQADI